MLTALVEAAYVIDLSRESVAGVYLAARAIPAGSGAGVALVAFVLAAFASVAALSPTPLYFDRVARALARPGRSEQS